MAMLGACVPIPSASPTPAPSAPTVPVTTNPPATNPASTDPPPNSSAAPPPTSALTTVAAEDETSAPTTAPTEPPAEQIAWERCPNSDLECGTVTVPVEYSDPSLGTLDIAVAINRANNPEQRIGVLFINPGGPGASGIEFAEWSTDDQYGLFSDEILDRFDMVAWDPRGVGESEPEFACGTDEEWLADRSQVDEEIDTPEEEQVARDAIALCQESMGPAAMRLGTYYVAQDMDQIRTALGEEQISYFGASYGSAIGVWYATLFPDRVRAMAVDGADNPVDDLSSDEAILNSFRQEYEGFETKLREALEACDTPSCPIYNDGDPVGFYLDHIDDLALVNDEFGGNPDAGFLAVITPLYDEREWPLLWSGLAAVADGDPGPLAQLAERQMMGEEGASDTGHINCLDAWSLGQAFDPQESVRVGELVDAELKDEMPLLWALPESSGFCAFFGEQTPAPLDRPFDGAGTPIVVIGNVSDPVTPFAESEELVTKQLTNGYLVVADAPAHVVYGRGNTCVDRIIEQVLVDAQLPSERRTECGTG